MLVPLLCHLLFVLSLWVLSLCLCMCHLWSVVPSSQLIVFGYLHLWSFSCLCFSLCFVSGCLISLLFVSGESCALFQSCLCDLLVCPCVKFVCLKSGSQSLSVMRFLSYFDRRLSCVRHVWFLSAMIPSCVFIVWVSLWSLSRCPHSLSSVYSVHSVL